MKAAERQLRIRQMFEAKDFLDLETLCRELDASESSVRRDLDVLEAESVLRRVYGGAVPVHQSSNGAFDFTVESGRFSDEKSRIARLTAGLIVLMSMKNLPALRPASSPSGPSAIAAVAAALVTIANV